MITPRTADDFKRQFVQLLPPGRAFQVQPGSNLDKLITGLTQEQPRIDSDAIELITEAQPDQTDQLLPDFEAEAGLPDDCAPAVQTVDQRRAALVQKLTLNQTITLAYLSAAAAALGFVVTIVKRHMRQYGTLYGGCLYGDTYGDSSWNYVIEVHAALINLQYRNYGSNYGEAYASWGNSLLECTLDGMIGVGVIRFIYT